MADTGPILVIDDDERIVELITFFLQSRGYEVLQATSFDEARKILEERDCRLVLSDLHFGGVTAAGDLQALALEGKLPPTVVVSGKLDEEVASTLRDLPSICGVLHKPFRLAELEQQVLSALESGS